MKKIKFLLTIIFVVATATLLQAQEVDDIYFSAPTKAKNTNKYMGFSNINADTSSVFAYELDYMRFCLGKYHKTRNTAYWLSGAALATSFLAMQTDGDTQGALLLVGGAAGISSVVTFIVAEKWLKRSAIKPSPNGLGVVIEF